MANSKTYIEQVDQLNENLQNWNKFIYTVSEIISQYHVNIDSLQQQIDNNEISIEGLTIYAETLENRIDALITKISEIEDIPIDVPTNKYIKLNKLSLDINTSKTFTYSNQIGVFSNDKTVYVFADRTVDGLTVGGKNVTDGSYFHKFNGTITGNKLSISTSDIEKTGIVVLSFNRTGNREDPMDASISIRIKHEKAAILPIIPPDGIKYATVLGKFSNAAAALNSKATQTSVLEGKISSQQVSNSLVANLSNQLGLNTKVTVDLNNKSNNLLNTTRTPKK